MWYCLATTGITCAALMQALWPASDWLIVWLHIFVRQTLSASWPRFRHEDPACNPAKLSLLATQLSQLLSWLKNALICSNACQY